LVPFPVTDPLILIFTTTSHRRGFLEILKRSLGDQIESSSNIYIFFSITPTSPNLPIGRMHIQYQWREKGERRKKKEKRRRRRRRGRRGGKERREGGLDPLLPPLTRRSHPSHPSPSPFSLPLSLVIFLVNPLPNPVKFPPSFFKKKKKKKKVSGFEGCWVVKV